MMKTYKEKLSQHLLDMESRISKSFDSDYESLKNAINEMPEEDIRTKFLEVAMAANIYCELVSRVFSEEFAEAMSEDIRELIKSKGEEE